MSNSARSCNLPAPCLNERLQYVLGAYYFEEDGTDDVFVPIYGALPTPAGLIALPLFINNYVLVDNSSKAVFGQGTFDLTEQIAVTFGLRYTEDEKELWLSPVHLPGPRRSDCRVGVAGTACYCARTGRRYRFVG